MYSKERGRGERTRGSIGIRVWCLQQTSAIKGRRTGVALIIRLKRQRALMMPRCVRALDPSLFSLARAHSLSLSLSLSFARSFSLFPAYSFARALSLCLSLCLSLLRALSLCLSRALSLSLSHHRARALSPTLVLLLSLVRARFLTCSFTSSRPCDEQKVPSDRETYFLSELPFRARHRLAHDPEELAEHGCDKHRIGSYQPGMNTLPELAPVLLRELPVLPPPSPSPPLPLLHPPVSWPRPYVLLRHMATPWMADARPLGMCETGGRDRKRQAIRGSCHVFGG